MERVQRRFTKRLSGLDKLSYHERLRRLGLASLELRSLHTDLIWCYEIVFGLADLQFYDFLNLSSNTHTRGHRFKLSKKHTSARVRSSFFCNRVISIWNYLPPAVVDFSSLSHFKRDIKSVEFTKFFKIQLAF